jgi:hypothetical protein
MSKLLTVVLGLFMAAGLTSCASDAAKAQLKKEREEQNKPGVEYVLYYPTGSNIPIKIPKDQAQTTEAQTQAAQDAMRDVQRNGARLPSDNGGH